MKILLTIFTVLSFFSISQAQKLDLPPLKDINEVIKVIEEVRTNHLTDNHFRNLFQSKSIVDEEVRIHPESAEAWYCLGFIEMLGLSRNKAKDAFKNAIKLKPDFAEAYQALGLYYQFPSWCGNTYSEWSKQERDQFYGNAIEAHLKAIELKADFAEAYHALGEVYYKIDNYEAAVKIYQKAIELNLDIPENYSGLSRSLEKLGRFEDAINAAVNHIQVSSNYLSKHRTSLSRASRLTYLIYESIKRISNLYNKLNRPQDALATFKKMVALKITNSILHLQLGLTYLSSGDKESAIAEQAILIKMSQDKESNQITRENAKLQAAELAEQIKKH
jgi:tetratricopeptide (TPR) repeat protein